MEARVCFEMALGGGCSPRVCLGAEGVADWEDGELVRSQAP